jgi:sugar lactone lactonase YvrE
MKQTTSHFVGTALCAGTALLLTASASAQNLYVSTENGAIDEFTPSGTESTFYSGLNNPFGIAFNTTGDLFVANSGGDDIVEISQGRTQSTFASGLYQPEDVAFDSSGNLWEVDFGSHNANTGYLHEFSTSGTERTVATGLNPPSMAFNSAGDLFVGDIESQSIYEFTPAGVETTFVSNIAQPFALAFNA